MMVLNGLIEKLQEVCRQQPFQISWYLRNVKESVEFSYNGNLIVPASSIRKLFIMMAVFSHVNSGHLDLDLPIELNHVLVEKSESSGCLQFLRPGFKLTLQDLITMMIIVSDNVATSHIMELISLEAVNNYCKSIGLENTVHRSSTPIPGINRDFPLEKMNTTTAIEVGYLLDQILQGSKNSQAAAQIKCTTELCALALNILGCQQEFTQFPELLPETAKIHHKHGYGIRNCGDAGIFFRNLDARFIFVVLIDNIPEMVMKNLPGHASAIRIIAKLAKVVWDELGN